MPDVELDVAHERIAAGQAAGDDYVETMEQIRDTLDADGDTGTTLGTMVSAQIQITEAETLYQIRMAIPKKVSKAIKTQAQALAQS